MCGSRAPLTPRCWRLKSPRPLPEALDGALPADGALGLVLHLLGHGDAVQHGQPHHGLRLQVGPLQELGRLDGRLAVALGRGGRGGEAQSRTQPPRDACSSLHIATEGVTAVLTNRKQLRMLGSTLLPPKAATSPSCRGTWMASWSRTPRCRWSHRPPAFATWLKRSAVGRTERQPPQTHGWCLHGVQLKPGGKQ